MDTDKVIKYLEYLETECEKRNIYELDDLIIDHLNNPSEVTEEDLNELSDRLRQSIKK